MSQAFQLLSDFQGDHLSVKMFGAVGDGVRVNSVTFTSGSDILTIDPTSTVPPGKTFQSSDVGKIMTVDAADPIGSPLGACSFGTITGYISPTQVHYNGPVRATGTAFGAWGTDDLTAINSAMSALKSACHEGASMFFPAGVYMVSGSIIVNGLTNRGIRGDSLLTWIWGANPAVPTLVLAATATNQSSNVTLDHLILFQPYEKHVLQIGGTNTGAFPPDGATTTTVMIHHCWINGGQDGVLLLNAPQNWISHCQFEGQKRYSIHSTSSSENVFVGNNFFLVGAPIRFDIDASAPRNSFSNVFSHNVTTAADAGMAYLTDTNNSVIGPNTTRTLCKSATVQDLVDGVFIGGNSYRNTIIGNDLNSAHEGDYHADTGCRGLRWGIGDFALAQQTYSSAFNYQVPDGSRRSWLLDYVVADTPTVKVNGVTKVCGVTGDTGKDWYWDAPTSKLTQDAGGAVLISTDALNISWARCGTVIDQNNIDSRTSSGPYGFNSTSPSDLGLNNIGYTARLTAKSLPRWNDTKTGLTDSGFTINSTSELSGPGFDSVQPDNGTLLESHNTSASSAQQFKIAHDGSGNVTITTPRASTAVKLNGGLTVTQAGVVTLPNIAASKLLTTDGSSAVASSGFGLNGSNELSGPGYDAVQPDSATLFESHNTSASSAQQFKIAHDNAGNVTIDSPRASTSLKLNGGLTITQAGAIIGPGLTASQFLKTDASKVFVSAALGASDVGLGNVTNDAQLKIASNLSDLNSAASARTNLGVDASLSVAGWTVTLAKITTTGANGSLTVDTHGRITAYTAPT